MSLELLENLGLDFETRKIYITDEIGKDVLNRVTVALSLLEKYEAPITIEINSPGGCLVSTLAIYDLIKSCKNVIYGYVKGEACSGASIILQACDHRVITPHSSVMIHYGSHGLPRDIPKNNDKLLKYYESLSKDMIRIYKSVMKVGKSVISDKKLDELMTFDSYLRANQAKRLNLVDEIAYLQPEHYEYEENDYKESMVVSPEGDEITLTEFLELLNG